MSLIVVVGSLLEQEDEWCEHLVQQFEAINRVLRAHSLPEHREPTSPAGDLPWEQNMFYGQVHDLRRLAAYLWLGLDLPAPATNDSTRDPVLRRFYDSEKEPDGNPGYVHLINHSDCDGFYIPIPFERVLYADPATKIAGTMVGSSQMLMAGCQQVAEALDLPLDLDPESDEAREAEESLGESDVLWQRYGRESYACLVFYQAAKRSIESGCAVVFS